MLRTKQSRIYVTTVVYNAISVRYNICCGCKYKYTPYPAFFYSRIPAAEDEYRAEKSFQRMSHMMHTAGNYQSAIRQHTTLWPKSIRRLLYSFPDYGFYLPEIELLGRLFPNADSFRAIFGRSFTYSLLSFFHQYRKGKHNMLLPEICESAYAQWKDKYHLVDADLQQEIDDDEFPYGHHYFPVMFF